MDEEDRLYNYIPKKYDVLRKVPAYENLIKEQFNRCLDLYLCPRARRKSDLKPFPTRANIYYKGHSSRVRAIAVNGTG